MVILLQSCLCAAMVAQYRKMVAILANNDELSSFNSPQHRLLVSENAHVIRI